MHSAFDRHTQSSHTRTSPCAFPAYKAGRRCCLQSPGRIADSQPALQAEALASEIFTRGAGAAPAASPRSSPKRYPGNPSPPSPSEGLSKQISPMC